MPLAHYRCYVHCRTLIGKPMLEVALSGQRGYATTGNSNEAISVAAFTNTRNGHFVSLCDTLVA